MRISQGLIAIGAPGAGGHGFLSEHAGSVHLFDTAGKELARLASTEGNENAMFGANAMTLPLAHRSLADSPSRLAP